MLSAVSAFSHSGGCLMEPVVLLLKARTCIGYGTDYASNAHTDEERIRL